MSTPSDRGSTYQRGETAPLCREGDCYAEGWYAVAAAEDFPAGRVQRVEFLDGHVAVFRGANGKLAAVSPYCRHFGADLSAGGEVIGDHLRCPYHHWAYGQDGACRDTAGQCPVPPGARLFSFPLVEFAGLVWIFNGSEATFALPTLDPGFTFRVLRGFPRLHTDPTVVMLNTFDLTHTRVVHGWSVLAGPDIEYRPRGVTVRQRLADAKGNTHELESTIFGLTGVVHSGTRKFPDGVVVAFHNVNAYTPMNDGSCQPWYVLAVPADTPEAEARLDQFEAFRRATFDEDFAILDNIGFRRDQFTKDDRLVSPFLEFAARIPRVHPSRDLIRR